MPPRIAKKTNKTVLFAVEGDTELAFLTHVKECYITRECNLSVRIRNARGHGPLGIVDALVSGSRGKDYDFLAAMLDSDIPLCNKSKNYFAKNKVKLFQSIPAIEATILSLGNNRLKENILTSECKRLLERLIPGDSMDIRFYERHFDKVYLDANRNRVLLVDELIKYLTAPA